MKEQILHPFEQCAVVFLDVLGFSSLVQDAEKLPHRQFELFGIVSVLDSHVRFDNHAVASEVPAIVRPEYIFISDSMIFSSPLRHGQYDGLGIVVAKTIQIAHKLFQVGYLLQGGINIGPVWRSGANVFGTGYIKAYQTQDNLIHPQVVLTTEAADHWQEHLAPLVGEMCFVDDEGNLNVDILNPNYLDPVIRGMHGGVEDQFRNYRTRIINQQDNFCAGTSPRKKWDWAARYFNRTIERHGINVQQI